MRFTEAGSRTQFPARSTIRYDIAWMIRYDIAWQFNLHVLYGTNDVH